MDPVALQKAQRERDKLADLQVKPPDPVVDNSAFFKSGPPLTPEQKELKAKQLAELLRKRD
jgi:hypothetical protein